MTRKRRGFRIDLDPIEPPQTDSVMAETAALHPIAQRRGPMASAIHETAGSLRDRAATEAQIRAENDALAHELVRLKKLGLVTDLIPLDLIDAAKLTRDRSTAADPEMADLLVSIREIGLSNPIRIEAQADGRYELVQGYRRLTAYRALRAETGDEARFGAIPATIMACGDTLERLYRQMIDENLVRKDISFAEMAQMAVQYAADPGTAETDPAKAVAKLYGSASYSRRSYIRSFIKVIAVLGDTLHFAPEIPRALGLALAERLEINPAIAQAIRLALQDRATRGVRDELDVLRQFAGGAAIDPSPPSPPSPGDPGRPAPPLNPPPAATGRRSGAAQTGAARISFDMRSPHGPVRCTLADGRIELHLNRDFSLIGRSRLEAAVQALLDRLG